MKAKIPFLCTAFACSMLIASSGILLSGCSKTITEAKPPTQDSTVSATDTTKTLPPSLEITIDPTKYYTAMAISPDGSLLALGDAIDRVIRIWNTKTGNLITTFPLAPITYPSSFRISKDNTKIIATDGMAPGFLSVLYDITAGLKICTIMSLRCFISDDGTKLIGDGFDTANTLAPKIHIYSPINGSIISDVTPPGLIPGKAQLFGITNGGNGFVFSKDNLNTSSPSANIWDINTNSASQTISLITKASGTLSEDGNIFAINDNDTMVVLYSTITGKIISSVHGYLMASDSNDYNNIDLPVTSITKNFTASLPVKRSGTTITLYNNSDGSVKSVMGPVDKNTISYKSIVMSRDESILAGWGGNTSNKIHIWSIK